MRAIQGTRNMQEELPDRSIGDCNGIANSNGPRWYKYRCFREKNAGRCRVSIDLDLDLCEQRDIDDEC